MSTRKVKQILQKKKQIEKIDEKQNSNIQQEDEYKFKTNIFEVLGQLQYSEQSEQLEQEQEQEQKNKQQYNNKIEIKKQNKKKKNKKKNKNKNKNKNKKINQEQKNEEIQKSIQNIILSKSKESQKQDIIQDIFNINQGKFNYQRQLRHHFKGWEQEKIEQNGELNRKQQKLQKSLRKHLKKSILSPGIKDFIPIREKFQVIRHENKISFQPTKKYYYYQKQYQQIKNSNDINSLFTFSQEHPQHVDSLYAVGQFLRLQGNYHDADNLIQKVIYIYQFAASYDLQQFIRQDKLTKQIVFDENSRSLFMSLFKFMDILGKKGCFRASLEYNKYLLKINNEDPTACLLCMDFNAISAKQYQFIIDFVKFYSSYFGNYKDSLYLLPNFTYSFALAKFLHALEPSKQEKMLIIKQNNIQSLLNFTQQDWNSALKLPQNYIYLDKQNPRILILRAIMVYPKLILDIAQKNSYNKQFISYEKGIGYQRKSFQDILSHQFWSIIPSSFSYYFLRLQSVNDSYGLDKVLQVYVERSKILWKSNSVLLFIKSALGFVINKINQKFNYQEYLESLCLEQSGGNFIPFKLNRYENINKNNFSDRVEQIDLNNIHDNQPMQQNNINRMGVQGNSWGMFLNSLLPWVHLPENGYLDQNMPFINEDQQ